MNRNPDSTALLSPVAGAILTEILTVCCLVVAGLVVNYTVLSIEPELSSNTAERLYTLAGNASWILAGAYGLVKLGLGVRTLVRARKQSASRGYARGNAGAGEGKLLGVFRAHRKTNGLPANVLIREDLLDCLQKELTLSQRQGKPVSLILTKVDLGDGENMFRDILLSRISESISSITDERTLLGHMGDDLFAVALPATSLGKGQRIRQQVCSEMIEIATEFGGVVRESLATSTRKDDATSLYSRGTQMMNLVEIGETGALRRVA